MANLSQPELSFTCPICLGSIRVLSTIPDNDRHNAGGQTGLNQSGSPVSIFEITSCNHQFCASCLRAYVRSKLMDGLIEIPCCHSMMYPWEEESRACGKLLSEDDLYKLILMDICDESKKNEWSFNEEENSSTSGSKEGVKKGTVEVHELWVKYQKLKFDKHHGKDVVRRCPHCEEAHLFDEKRMKEFQTNFLTRNDGNAASGRTNNVGANDSTGVVNRFDRMFSSCRQSRRSTENAPNNAVTRNEKDDVTSTAPEHEGKEQESQKQMEQDAKPLEGVDSPSSPSVNDLQVDALSTSVDAKALDGVNSALTTAVDNRKDDCLQDGEGNHMSDRVPSDTSNPDAVQSRSPPLEDDDLPTEDEIRRLEVGDAALTLSADVENDSCLEDGDCSSASSSSKSPKPNNPDIAQNHPLDLGGTAPVFTCQPCSPEPDVSTQNNSTGLVKSIQPVVTCWACSSEFCYFHSNAHSGKSSCVEYHKVAMEHDRANIEYANSTLRAKPCPACGISVSKEGGCNQMKCGSCGTHFCWLCGVVVDDSAFPEHFRWWNLRGCANMQLDEADEPLTCTIWGARLLSAFQIIVLGIPSLVMALVSMLLCPCFVPGCGRTNRERVINVVSFWGSFISSMLLLPFTCLGMILLSALYCFLAAIALFVKVVSSRTGQGGVSEESGNATSVQGDINMNTSMNDAHDDFIRELENIFERLEEGRIASDE